MLHRNWFFNFSHFFDQLWSKKKFDRKKSCNSKDFCATAADDQEWFSFFQNWFSSRLALDNRFNLIFLQHTNLLFNMLINFSGKKINKFIENNYTNSNNNNNHSYKTSTTTTKTHLKYMYEFLISDVTVAVFPLP